MSASRSSGKLVWKGSALVREAIRARIVAGELAPGAALPSNVELARQYGVSNVTVLQGLNPLAEQGFLEIRRRVGSFVHPQPPHLHQLGLVFWNDPNALRRENHWSRYFQALTMVAADFERLSGRRVLRFHGVDWHADTADYQRLVEHLATQRLAGVIFANIPLGLDGSPVLELPGIPRVAIETSSLHPNVRTVTFAAGQWLAKALDWLAAQGRRRVATIRLATTGPEDGWGASEEDVFRQAVQARGLETRPRWLHHVSINRPDETCRIVDLLMADRERPDALLVEDDNFVEPALAGLVAAGARVPEDVAVVGHANFPLPPAKTLPIRLLGYDQRAILRAAVEMIDRCRAGEPPPETTTVPALWEEELPR